MAVRERQLHRFRAEKISAMTRRMIGKYCRDVASEQMLGAGQGSARFISESLRSHLEVSRTIADL
jgi:predicted ATPase with chaperone activity